MATTDDNRMTNIEHLVVMIHGFWGNPNHLDHLRNTLLESHKNTGIKVYVPSSNRDNNTYDGIEVGAERITHEVLELIEQLKQDGHSLRKFSIVGYSLGGLIARYVVGLLQNDGLFDKVEPMNFTTFASPHLGVRSPKTGYQVDTWNWLGSNLLSVSGQQLYLTDNFRQTGRPLLDILADPDSSFIRGLRRFERRTVYANIQHDPAVPYYSAAFSRHDPYVNLDAVDLHFLELPDGSQDVVLDPAKPVCRKESSIEQPQSGWIPQWAMSERTLQSLPFFAAVSVVAPIGIPIFLGNAAYQTYQSSARVKTHEAGDKLDLKRYRLPFFEETQRLQDATVEGLENASGEDYLPIEKTNSDKVDTDGEWPTLALTTHQFSMIEHLDSVGFTKFACYIKIRRAHAAMIVRAKNPSFEDGKVICKHWADNFIA